MFNESKMSRFLIENIMLVLVLLLSGCNSIEQQVTPTLPSQIVSSSTPSISSARYTSTYSPTRTNTPVPKCPTSSEGIDFDLSIGYESMEEYLLEYYNSGGKLEDISIPSPPKGEITIEAREIDIDGDSYPEVISVVSSSYDESEAKVLVYRCGQGEYQLANSFIFQDVSFAKISFVDQLFESYPAMLMLRIPPTSGWSEKYVAVGWFGDHWDSVILGWALFPSSIMLFDQDGDGIKEVLINSNTSVSLAAGIGREEISTYKWDGYEFVLVASDFPPGTNRVHYLDDAQYAIDNGNPMLALEYYEIAAKDLELPSSPTQREEMINQTHLSEDYQRGFSYFRMISIWFNSKRPDMAQPIIDEMQLMFPENSPGHEFVITVDYFITLLEDGSEYSEACSMVGAFIDEVYPDVMDVHIGDWGFANVSYSDGVDLCIFD